jgi:putative transcriptional regulator
MAEFKQPVQGESRQTLNAVQTGKHAPSLTLALAITDVFEKTIADIFEPASHS